MVSAIPGNPLSPFTPLFTAYTRGLGFEERVTTFPSDLAVMERLGEGFLIT